MLHHTARRIAARHTSITTVTAAAASLHRLSALSSAAASASASSTAAVSSLPHSCSPCARHSSSVTIAASSSSASSLRFYSTSRSLSADAAAAAPAAADGDDSPSFTIIKPNPKLICLSDLQPKEGTMKKAKRYGRGHGTGLGKTAGKGHKGQGQRKGTRKRGFEGGSTPFWRRTPKLSVSNAQRYWKMLTPLSVKKIQEFIKMGRIDGNQLITMRTLYDSGCLPHKVEHGVKLLSGGLTRLDVPIHIQLTDCSEQARTLLESHHGSVHLVWFNRMTLRAHLRPVHFLRKYGRLPKATGVPPPKKAAKYGFVVEHVDY